MTNAPTHILQRGFDKIFNLLKQPVTIRAVTTTYNSKGDPSESYSDTETYGVVEEITEDFTEIGVGYIDTGKTIIYLDPSESVSEGNQIIVGSTTYLVDKVRKGRVEGTDIYIACDVTKL